MIPHPGRPPQSHPAWLGPVHLVHTTSFSETLLQWGSFPGPLLCAPTALWPSSIRALSTAWPVHLPVSPPKSLRPMRSKTMFILFTSVSSCRNPFSLQVSLSAFCMLLFLKLRVCNCFWGLTLSQWCHFACTDQELVWRVWSLYSPSIHRTALTHWLRVLEYRSPAPFAVSWNKYLGITYTLGPPVVSGWSYLLWELIGNHTLLGSFPFGVSTPGYRFLLEAFLYKSCSWKSLPNPCLSPAKTCHEKLVKLYEVKW